MNSYPAFSIDGVTPLADKEYYWFVLDRIRRAKYRIWASIFIVNVTRADDPRGEVRKLIEELAAAADRKIDVRFLVPTNPGVLSLEAVNRISVGFMRMQHVSTRQPLPTERRGHHDKFVIFDHDTVVLGSHNWTDTAFNLNSEDSLAVQSDTLVRVMEGEFLSQWPGKRSLPQRIAGIRMASSLVE